MPVIHITEKEESNFASFDASANTVLIPLLCERSVNASDTAMLYKNASIFKNDFSGRVAQIGDNLNDRNEYDKSFIMAYELLLRGLNVVIKPILFDGKEYIDGESLKHSRVISLEKAYKLLNDAIVDNDILKEFKNRNIYNLKFITSGAYSNVGTVKSIAVDSEGNEILDTEGKPIYVDLALGIGTALAKLASYNPSVSPSEQGRGDAVALIEFKEYYNDESDLFKDINGITFDDDLALFSAAFFPWCEFNTSISSVNSYTQLLPACFGYLCAYANSIKSNANWFAAAGVIRGEINNFRAPNFEVGEGLMHVLQCDEDADDRAVLNYTVNPIYNAGVYGYRVWGNRVMYHTTFEADRYMNFLNVRMLLCDIKKQIYHSAMRCTFEPNDDIVWINFKTLTNTLLDQMKSGRGISWYKWVKEYTDEKAVIKATLTIKPIEAVESFKVTVWLTDEEAEIVEETV